MKLKVLQIFTEIQFYKKPTDVYISIDEHKCFEPFGFMVFYFDGSLQSKALFYNLTVKNSLKSFGSGRKCFFLSLV